MRARLLLLLSAASVGSLITIGSWEKIRFESPPADVSVDRIVVKKRERTMTVYRGSVPLKSYKIALGSVPDGTPIELDP